MRYIKVKWIHRLPNEPIELYSELDKNRYEVRKIEVFRDGRLGYAGRNKTDGDTRLGIEPVPCLEKIASDPQFAPEEISKDEFDAMWIKAAT